MSIHKQLNSVGLIGMKLLHTLCRPEEEPLHLFFQIGLMVVTARFMFWLIYFNTFYSN